ncbi:MAG: SDR family NAD(P)-dependent oxidoreductase [Candidatus Dormibacteria bacterium]
MTPGRDVAVVTGAGRGIGRAIARHLAASHAVVAVARTESELQETARGHPGITPAALDLLDPASVDAAATRGDQLGTLRVWVNNAATLEVIPVAELDDDTWRRILALNLDAAFRGCRAAIRRMSQSGGGVIVNLASLSGVPVVDKFAGLSAYNASKAALVALTETVAVEGRAANVRCVAISPGAVDTALLRRAAPHLRPGMTADDVAAIVDFLVSDAAGPLSGSNIPILSNR